MFKILTYDTVDDHGQHAHVYDPRKGLEKTATSFSSELKEVLDAIEPTKGSTYILLNALSAGEYFGPNRNGDYFPEGVLKQYHKTFEALARPYKHHINKDPKKSYGKVLFSFYNDEMHRVELVLQLDNKKAQDIVQRIINGENVAVSMGCKVPFDICSICGNKAKRVSEYCEHLQKGSMNTIHADGRRNYAINTRPKFFDISFIGFGAEPTAYVMLKIASMDFNFLPRSAEIGEVALKAAGMKESQIMKEVHIGGKIKSISSDPKALIIDSQPEMPKQALKVLAEEYPLSEILSTFQGLRIMPKAADFQRLVLYKMGKFDLADRCDQEKILFPMDMDPVYSEDVSLENFNPKIAKVCQHLVPARALTKPLVIMRVMQKRAELAEDAVSRTTEIKQTTPIWHKVLKKEVATTSVKNPFFALAGIGGLYAAYNKLMSLSWMGGKIPYGQFERVLLKNPWLWPLLIAGTAVGATQAQNIFVKKEAQYLPDVDNISKLATPIMGPTLKSILIGVPATYMYAGYQEAKKQRGEPIGDFSNIIRKHPFLSSIGGTVLLRKFFKGFAKTAKLEDVLYDLNDEALDKVYQNVIGNS